MRERERERVRNLGGIVLLVPELKDRSLILTRPETRSAPTQALLVCLGEVRSCAVGLGGKCLGDAACFAYECEPVVNVVKPRWAGRVNHNRRNASIVCKTSAEVFAFGPGFRLLQ